MTFGHVGSAGSTSAAPIAIAYVTAKARMSARSTPASTSIASRVGRRRACHQIAAPVTNIASVASMNGAPRIAPTPISSEWAPAVNTIAMIGIIVSGRAVPTAASTEPTAPSARPSFRPNHAMPFVNSSAPARMTRKAIARMTRSNTSAPRDPGRDAGRDDDEDQPGDHGHALLALPHVADERRHDPRSRGRERAEQAEPDEAGRAEGHDVIDDPRRIEGRGRQERRRARCHRQDRADREQCHGRERADRQQPGDPVLEAVRWNGVHAGPIAFCAISNAVYRSTATNSHRRTRMSIRWAIRDPIDAPTNTPTAVGAV